MGHLILTSGSPDRKTAYVGQQGGLVMVGKEVKSKIE